MDILFINIHAESPEKLMKVSRNSHDVKDSEREFLDEVAVLFWVRSVVKTNKWTQ